MKKSLTLSALLFAATLATLAVSARAQACDAGYDSMLFGGYARNIQKTAAGCTFQIEVNSKVFPPKVETGCALFPGEVGTLFFKDASCSLTDGAEVSGVMQLNRETGETRIQ